MRIEFLSPESEIDPDNDNVDVMAILDDGKEYIFLIATPANIVWCMDNEGLDYSFGVPPLLVRRLTRENVNMAIQALFEDPIHWNIYGTLQSAGI